MLDNTTMIVTLLAFFITVIFSEKYLAKNPPQFGLLKVMVITLILFIIIGSCAILLPVLEKLWIALAVAIGAFISIYGRHRANQRKGWKK